MHAASIAELRRSHLTAEKDVFGKEFGSDVCGLEDEVLSGRPPVGRRWLESGGKEQERSEEHTSELQSRENLVCRLLLEKKTERQAPITTAPWFRLAVPPASAHRRALNANSVLTNAFMRRNRPHHAYQARCGPPARHTGC